MKKDKTMTQRAERGKGTTRTTPARAPVPSPSTAYSSNSAPTFVPQPPQSHDHPKTAPRKTHWRENPCSESGLGCVVAWLKSAHIHVRNDVHDVIVVMVAWWAHLAKEVLHGADGWRVVRAQAFH